ncbi:hypothetical protein [Priestia megaterium]|uniref:hypothetical protein n=1 Tax=Priestia megaterium TaxID=1404 RepID=UPI00207A5338|nr:hypothetical protein [Priestia megaterium]USL39600.1 hypothetical protein LIT34_30170 [Priestia megaterium]
MGAKVTNNTNEFLFFYAQKGTNSDPKFNKYDNAVYRLDKGETSLDSLDADGFYVPADRKLKDFSGDIIPGPVSVKIRHVPYIPGIQHATITQEGAIYIIDTVNHGVFKPSEWCDPSDWPKCVNWCIPNKIYAEVLESFI